MSHTGTSILELPMTQAAAELICAAAPTLAARTAARAGTCDVVFSDGVERAVLGRMRELRETRAAAVSAVLDDRVRPTRAARRRR